MKLIAAFEIRLLAKDSWDKKDLAEGRFSAGFPILCRRKLLFSDHEDHKDGVKVASSIGDIASDIFEPNAGSSWKWCSWQHCQLLLHFVMIMAACAINDS